MANAKIQVVGEYHFYVVLKTSLHMYSSHVYYSVTDRC